MYNFSQVANECVKPTDKIERQRVRGEGDAHPIVTSHHTGAIGATERTGMPPFDDAGRTRLHDPAKPVGSRFSIGKTLSVNASFCASNSRKMPTVVIVFDTLAMRNRLSGCTVTPASESA